MGPQSDPAKVVNVGVAAHITAAARGGPRFDLSLSDRDRRSAANGIWLCQNCAKLIDSDEIVYSVTVLISWKMQAESQARAQIGRTQGQAAGSFKKTIAALKRDQAMRDSLHHDLLRPYPERVGLPRDSGRTAKFAYGELIIHRIDDTSYPDIDDSPGISGWFKVEVWDFYHNGLHVIVDLRPALHDTMTRRWSLLTAEQNDVIYPGRFRKQNVFITGKIPWRNILHYDLQGDEFYPQPHVYCAFADDAMPYEGWGYFTAIKGYQWELQAGDKMELEALLLTEPETWVPARPPTI